jgi:hypothetical protein
VLRCAYVDLDAALLGPGLGARALEACGRADVEVVLYSRTGAAEIAERLGLRAWFAGDALHLDGEKLAVDDPAAAVAHHLRARAWAPEEAVAVGADLAVAPAVGMFWLVGGDPAADPLLALELERHPNMRLPEGRGEAALYEAVVTTLMERRS